MPWTVCVRSPTVPPGWTTVRCVAGAAPPFQLSTTIRSTVDRICSWLASQSDLTDTTSTTATWSARVTMVGRSSASTSDARAGDGAQREQPQREQRPDKATAAKETRMTFMIRPNRQIL